MRVSFFVKVCNIQVAVASLLGTIYPHESSAKNPQTWAHLGYVLSTGSRDHHILHRDVRQPAPYMRTLESIRICAWHMWFYRIGKVSLTCAECMKYLRIHYTENLSHSTQVHIPYSSPISCFFGYDSMFF